MIYLSFFVILLNSVLIVHSFYDYFDSYGFGWRYGMGYEGNGGIGIRGDGRTLSDLYGIRSPGLMSFVRPNPLEYFNKWSKLLYLTLIYPFLIFYLLSDQSSLLFRSILLNTLKFREFYHVQVFYQLNRYNERFGHFLN